MPRPEANKNDEPRSTAIETNLDTFTPAEEKALADFDCWMDAELERLIARWSHLAAPNASKRSFGRHSL